MNLALWRKTPKLVRLASAIASLWFIEDHDAHARCTEQSQTLAVGMATCRRFGDWETHRGFDPSIRLLVQTHAAFMPSHMTLCDNSKDDDCTPFAKVNTRAWRGRPVLMPSLVLDTTWLAVGPMRVGTQLSLGFGNANLPAVTYQGTSFRPGTFIRAGGALTLGLRAGRGRWVFGVDILPGLVAYSAGAEGLLRNGTEARITVESWTLAGRVNLSYFFTPWIAATGHAGFAVSPMSDLFVGAGLLFTTAAYDGTR